MIVRGAFSQLLAPGLRKALLESLKPEDWLDKWIREQEQMPIINPDLSKIPKWRLPVRRKESPIIAYRAWDLRLQGRLSDPIRRAGRAKVCGPFRLCSVAVENIWEGPVVRADAKPLDPALWDAAKKEKRPYHEYLAIQEHTFNNAGIWSVKTHKQVLDVSRLYRAPAYGEVALWGRVVQFTLGYRAELCMIKKLWLDTAMFLDEFAFDMSYGDERKLIKLVVSDLEECYQCDVEPAQSND